MVIDRMWDAVKDTLYISRAQFEKSLEGFVIVPEYNGDDMVAAVMHQGPVFHFITLGPKWQLTREMLRKWPGSLIKQYGYAETYTPLEDTRQHRFNKRLGFVEIRRDAQNIYYRIEGMKSCQL